MPRYTKNQSISTRLPDFHQSVHIIEIHEREKNEEKYSNNKVMSLKLFISCLHDYEMQCINGKKNSHIKKLDDLEVFLTVPPSEYEKVPQGSLFK